MQVPKYLNNNWTILLFLLILNLIVKGIFLTNTSIAGDEPFSIYHAQLSIHAIIVELSSGNNPPLYEMFLHFWIKIFGISTFSVRFPSLIFSTLTVFFMYKIGEKYLTKSIGIVACVLFIFSNYQIIYAHQARVYTLLALFTTVSMYYYLKLVKEGLKTVDLIALILVNTLMIYAHYFGLFVLLIQSIHLLFNIKILKRNWKSLSIAAASILVFYIPTIQVIIQRFLKSTEEGTWVRPPNGIVSLYNMLNTFNNAPVVNVAAIAILIIATVKFLINNKLSEIEISKKLIIIWFVFPFFFMFFISYYLPIFHQPYLMFATIGYYFLLAMSANYLISIPKYQYIIPFIICILYAATTKPNITNKRNIEQTVEKIKELKTDKAVVYICPYWLDLTFLYYYDLNEFINPNLDTLENEKMYDYFSNQNIFPIDTFTKIDTQFIKTLDKIIFLDADANFALPNNGIKDFLDKNYPLESHHHFYQIFDVYEYRLSHN